MIVRNFLNSDIEKASQITHTVWGNLYVDESADLQKLIYDFTLEYYYLNKNFSFALDDDGLCGLIFASSKTDENLVTDEYKNKISSFNEKDRKTALNLFDYVENTGKEVKKVMNNDDLMMGLFISRKKGGGKMLLSKLKETAIANEIKNIYLWTDTTCDFDYYQKNNFTLVKEFECIVNNKKINTLIFKKTLSNK